MAEDQLQDEDAFQPRINFALWRKMILFARPYRRQMLGLSITAMMCAGCDMMFPWLTGKFIDEVTLRGAGARLWPTAIAYLVVVTTLASCIYAFIRIAGKITTGVSYDIREAAFNKLQNLPFSFYDRKAV